MAGNPLLSATVHRLTSLSQGSSAEPVIRYSDHAAYRQACNMDFQELQEGEQDPITCAPLISYRQRLKTEQDIIRLQLSYRTTHLRFARWTQTNQRIDLINRHTHKDATGAVCAYIGGLVTDFSMNADGSMARICLLAPNVTDDPRRPNMWNSVDSHLWLRANMLRVNGDFYDKKRSQQVKNRKNTDQSGAVYIGDYLMVAAQIMAYETHGRRRLGVGLWTPTGHSLMYGFTGVDNHTRLKHVPQHLLKHMRVLKITRDGIPLWADPSQLTAEIARWERKFPEAAGELSLMRDVRI